MGGGGGDGGCLRRKGTKGGRERGREEGRGREGDVGWSRMEKWDGIRWLQICFCGSHVLRCGLHTKLYSLA